MATKIADVVTGIDRAMGQLRQSMRGIQIRTAGFKTEHDALAHAVSHLTVILTDAQALTTASTRRRRRR